MESKMNHLIQKAGKDLFLGKPALALEQYLKIHELDSEDYTVINTVADLHAQIGDVTRALEWYEKLVAVYERQGLLANATAAYRKILKMAPDHKRAMIRLAELYELQGQISNAKLQYKLCAHVQSNQPELTDSTLYLYRKICALDPNCHESHLKLAQLLEKSGMLEEAIKAYFHAARLLAERENTSTVPAVLEKVLQLNPQGMEILSPLFTLLAQFDLAETGVAYLLARSGSPSPDAEGAAELLLKPENLPLVKKYLRRILRRELSLFPAALRLVQLSTAKEELELALDLAESLFDTAIPAEQLLPLRRLLEYIHSSVPSTVRALELLVSLLGKVQDREALESHLRELAILHLKGGNLTDARECIHRIITQCHNQLYFDMITWLNEGRSLQGNQQRQSCQQIILALEKGTWEMQQILDADTQGAADLDLGLGLEGLGTDCFAITALEEISSAPNLPAV